MTKSIKLFDYEILNEPNIFEENNIDCTSSKFEYPVNAAETK